MDMLAEYRPRGGQADLPSSWTEGGREGSLV